MELDVCRTRYERMFASILRLRQSWRVEPWRRDDPPARRVITDRLDGSRLPDAAGALRDADRVRAAASAGADLHVHRGTTDAFYVLEGTLAVALGPAGARGRAADAGTLGLRAAEPRPHVPKRRRPTTLLRPERPRPGGGFAEMLRARRARAIRAPGTPSIRLTTAAGRWRDALVSDPGEGERLRAAAERAALQGAGDGPATGADADRDDGRARIPRAAAARPRAASRLLLRARGNARGARSATTRVEAPPGTFAAFPPGTPHTFSNPGDEPVRA